MQRLKIKAHQVVLVVGILTFAGTLISGVLPRITEWHDASPIRREDFGDVPDAIY